MNPSRTAWILAFALVFTAHRIEAASCTVPVDVGCGTIQAALDQATPGDTVHVNAGVYSEKVTFSSSGDSGSGHITLEGAPGHTSILDGTGVTGENMILIDSRSYVKVVGLTIRNNFDVSDGSGIRVQGSGSHIELRDNVIHDMRGKNAMGITFYGTQATSISNVIVDGNEIYDCEPAPSETLTLNGNVEQFEVTNNYVHDVNNIGIDFIGGELDVQPDPTKVTRNGVCRGNHVARARSIYGGGYAGAIYVDGAKDMVIERNVTTESDLGLEVGSENPGIISSGVIVRDNILYRNDKVGLVFGGYSGSVGQVKDCSFTNNTLYHNDTLGEGFGELWIQFAENNTIRNNLFVSERDVVLRSEDGNVGNTLDYNLWLTSAGTPTFVWQNVEYNGLAAFQSGSGQDNHALSVDPQFVNAAAADFHLRSTSPARNAGDPAFVAGVGEVDIDAATRVSAVRVDLGADEITCGDNVVDSGETCDDGNLTDCDGCDSNCTDSTTCGNGIRCGAEQCDDGNAAAGDCCDATCAYEAAMSPCDDARLCTNNDACDGAGTCAGSATPIPPMLCRQPIDAHRSRIKLADGSPDDKDRLSWTWSKGALTTLADFGDPTSNTAYALCVYDQSLATQPVLDLEISAGGTCQAKPCWKAGSKGFKFASRRGSAASSGVTKIKLAEGIAGKARISLAGRGEFLPDPSLGWTAPATIQLRNSTGECWGAVYSAPTSNGPGEFRAASD